METRMRVLLVEDELKISASSLVSEKYQRRTIIKPCKRMTSHRWFSGSLSPYYWLSF
jgi:hypothetical protein